MDLIPVLGEQVCSAGLPLTLLCPAVAFAICFTRGVTEDLGGHQEGNGGGIKRERSSSGVQGQAGDPLIFELGKNFSV